MWQHDMFEATEKLFADEQQSEKRKDSGPATIIVCNLHHEVSEQDLHGLFSLIGELQEVCMHFDKSGRSLGSARVCFRRKIDAIEAISQYNGRELDQKTLKIELYPSGTEKAVT